MVKADWIRAREVNALLQASEKHRCSDLLILTYDEETEIRVKNLTISVQPVWKWLLRNRNGENGEFRQSSSPGRDWLNSECACLRGD